MISKGWFASGHMDGEEEMPDLVKTVLMKNIYRSKTADSSRKRKSR